MVDRSTGLSHPSDKAHAVDTFRALRKGRYTWDPDVIHAWALANGWGNRGPEDLTKYEAPRDWRPHAWVHASGDRYEPSSPRKMKSRLAGTGAAPMPDQGLDVRSGNTMSRSDRFVFSCATLAPLRPEVTAAFLEAHRST